MVERWERRSGGLWALVWWLFEWLFNDIEKDEGYIATHKNQTNMKGIVLSTMLALMCIYNSNAQSLGYSPGDINEALGKKLIVLTDNESEKAIEGYSKRLEKANDKKRQDIEKAIAVYKERSELYRDNILSILAKYWEHGKGEDIRLVTEGELNSIKRQSDADNYVVMYLRTLHLSGSTGQSVVRAGLPVITLQPIGKYPTNLKLIAFPEVLSGVEQPSVLDFELTVMLFNNYLKKAKTASKKLSISDWMEAEVAMNCSLISFTPLNVRADEIEAGKLAAKAKAAYSGELKTLSTEAVKEAYNMSSEELLSVVLPVSIGSGFPNEAPGMIQYQTLNVVRISVQPSGAKICGMTGLFSADNPTKVSYDEKQLKQLSKCEPKK